MKVSKKNLRVKKSRLPDAGMGLFTTVAIPKGTRIVEYVGKISTWKEVEHDQGENGYIYYVKRNHVIDARRMKSALARYANDANGINRVTGLKNNSAYTEDGIKVFIQAARDINAGEEIFVAYGKEYWDAIRFNIALDRKREKEEAKELQRKKK